MCGNCLNETQCNHINGSCMNGCDPGWEGDLCGNGKSRLKTIFPKYHKELDRYET